MANTVPYFEAPKVKQESLYDRDSRYTDAAQELSAEVRLVLRPTFKNYFNYGYSPREIAHILQEVVRDLESEAIL